MKDLNKTQQQQVSSNREVDGFLAKVRSTPLATPLEGRGRLIFAMDATASREASWTQASRLQGDMFTHTRGIGQLDVQLLYYRGQYECRASSWVNNSKTLLKLMQSVHCKAGMTQIERVLKHTLAEAADTPVQALVFIGDCVEEDAYNLTELAGRLKIVGILAFIFQEGYDEHASQVFGRIARLSGGAHCRFDHRSAQQLGDLLNAVATYAAGGAAALEQLAHANNAAIKLLQQLGQP